MVESSTFLKQLISMAGISGYEDAVREVISSTWRPLVDELSVSKLGSLHGLRRGSGPAPRRRLLLSAHMDAIGLMVTGIADGLIRFVDIGGVDPRILPGQPVLVHGRKVLPGVVLQPSDRLLPPSLAGKPAPIEHLLVDTGLLPKEVSRLVRPGDLISFAQPPIELAGETLAGHSLDNRASVAALTLCLDELQRTAHAWDIWAVASVQEETVLGGAFTSPFSIRPDLAIAIDVTHARGTGASDYRSFPSGKGPVLGWGPNIHPAIHKSMKEMADRLDIPYAIEPMPRHSGTDAIGMQVVAEGIPCMVVSIPLRYMHTPVELVALKDISRTAHLLAEFCARLEPAFFEKIVWDEQ